LGKDIVCASVSSAVMMTANLITEIFGFNAEVSDVNNVVALRTDIPGEENLQRLYKGLEMQIEQISLEFKKTIKMKFTEV